MKSLVLERFSTILTFLAMVSPTSLGGSVILHYGDDVSLNAGNWHIYNITEDTHQKGIASIAVDSQSRPYVVYSVWARPDILNLTYWDGKDWVEQTLDDSPMDKKSQPSSMEIDENDGIHIAYRLYDVGVREDGIVYLSNLNGTWTKKIIEQGDTLYSFGDGSSLELDSKGHPKISYTGEGDVRYASSDGATWSIQQVDNTFSVDAPTSLALDTKDRPHMTYYYGVEKTDRYAVRIGGSWQNSSLSHHFSSSVISIGANDVPQLVSTGPGGLPLPGTYPLIYSKMVNGSWESDVLFPGLASGLSSTIAIDSHGYPHIAYSSLDSWVNYAYWTGTYWITETVEGPITISGKYALTLDANDVPFIAYKDSYSYIVHVATKSNLSSNPPPVADAGPDQTVHEGDIVQFNGTGSRGSPSNRTIVTSDGSEDFGLNPWKPRAASSPDGTLYVVWLGPADADEFHRRIFLSKRGPGGSWEAPVQVTSWSKYENAPSIAVGSLGEIHIAFESFVPESDLGDIYVVSSFDAGRTFENPVRVDDAPSGMGSYYPEIEVASDGTVYVAWYDTRNGGYDVYVASSRDAGRSFSQDRIVNDTTGQHIPPGKRHSGTMHPTLDSGPAGTLYVAWPSGVAWSGIWTDRSTDYGDSWNTDLRIDNSTAWGCGPERPSLIVDPNGSIHVFWADYRLGNIAPGIFILMPEIYYAHSEDDGVSYAPNQKANPEEWRKDRMALPPSSASDSEGTLFVAYAFSEGWYNHSVRAIVSTDHGSSFQLNASLDTRLRPGEWLARDIVEAYSWRSGCFGMVWLLEHLEPGVKVVVWDSCLSTSEQNVITSYEWDFDASIDSDGDGNYTNDKEATGPTPTHIYYDNGNYTVTLKVTDDSGQSDIDTCTATILNVAPTAETNGPFEGDEPHTVQFTGTFSDPGTLDTHIFQWDFDFDGITFNVDSTEQNPTHQWQDDFNGTVAFKVIDDDGGWDLDVTHVTVNNLPPEATANGPYNSFEGTPIQFTGNHTDPGPLDTHTYEWDFSYDGTTFNSEAIGNPYQNTWYDDHTGNIALRVTDDDGGWDLDVTTVTIVNVPPIANAGDDKEGYEVSTFTFNGSFYDPGTLDTHTIEWDFDYDGMTFDVEATGQTVSHTWIDDFDGYVALRVTDDDGGAGMDTAHVLVKNVPPTVTLEVLPIEVDAFLRIAGEKWHDVSIELYEDGVLMANGTLVRYPGSPNDQMLDLSSLQFDYSKKYSAIVRYTPEDDPINGQPNGANPCWIILNFSDGEELWIHHTFNVQHPETYIWEVDLTAAILSHGLTFKAIASDPGADELTFHWDFGDGTNVTTFYPNANETYPVEIMEIINHAFPGSGTYTVTVTVEDDDGGVGVAMITVTIP